MKNPIGPMRRALMGVAAVACCMLLALRFAAAQSLERPVRIGFITANRGVLALPVMRALVDGLRDLGYVEGRHYSFEVCTLDNQPERHSVCASELIQLRVDIFLVGVCGVPLDRSEEHTSELQSR